MYNKIVNGTTIELNKLKYRIGVVLAQRNIDFDRLDWSANYVVDTIEIFLDRIHLAESRSLAKTFEYSYPDGWWQMFKLQYFPRWALKRWPIKYITEQKTTTFRAHYVYPKFKPSLDEEYYLILSE